MKISNAQRSYIALIVVVAIASLVYRYLDRHHLEQTALLFVGIPTLLGIAGALTNPPQTAKGASVRAVTLGLLLAGPLLGEGFICLLMSAPIFYVVALVIGSAIDYARNRRQAKPISILSVALFVPFVFEGVTPQLSLPREQFVSATEIVTATPTQVEAALAQPPRVNETLPRFLRIGFPRPAEAHGSGLRVGDLRVIHFAGGEGRPGDLTMQVAEASPGHALFTVVSDRSKIAHWLDWRSSEVTYTAIDATHTRVTWKIGFTRRLDPAWYFAPWERLAIYESAEYLIRANATPQALGTWSL